jgi:hypothetical protein
MEPFSFIMHPIIKSYIFRTAASVGKQTLNKTTKFSAEAKVYGVTGKEAFEK